jgi:hypothetical protein
MSSATSPIDVHGTSFASPQVAAAAALAKSLDPSLTTAQLTNLILITSSRLGDGYSTTTGSGMLNTYAMLNYINDVINVSVNPNINPSATGDNLTDLIAHNNSAGSVNVTPSTGANFGGGFKGYVRWNNDTDIQGTTWKMLTPADVNGDGKKDLIGLSLTTSEVKVVLSDGALFGKGNKNALTWNSNTGYSSLWQMQDPGDVNGDGKADLIAFKPSTREIYVTLSDGVTFGGGFSGALNWNSDSAYNTSDWQLLSPSDVTGDGRVDIIAFNPKSTRINVTPSTGTNFGGGYRGYQIWSSISGYNPNEWTVLKPADVNGDGKEDIIAFLRTNTKINVTLSTGGNFGGGFKGYQIWNTNSGYNVNEWTVLAPSDVNGDGKADIIAFLRTNTKVNVTLSTGGNFGGGFKGYQIWNTNSGYNTSDWRLLY